MRRLYAEILEVQIMSHECESRYCQRRDIEDQVWPLALHETYTSLLSESSSGYQEPI